MKALVEKKTQFIEVNEKFSELVTTTYFLGVPVFRNSKKLTAPYGTSLSFDEKEILLQTADGKLQIRGSGLHVKGLNLEKGEAALAGHVDSLVYLSKDSPRKEEPLFTRLFR